MGEHIQSNVLAGQIAGICSEKSILLIGLIPYVPKNLEETKSELKKINS